LPEKKELSISSPMSPPRKKVGQSEWSTVHSPEVDYFVHESPQKITRV